MIVYRISKWQYLEDLSGAGARIHGGRWNREGLAMLYTSSSLSLAVLEILVNHRRDLINKDFGFLALSIPDSFIEKSITVEELSSDWRRPYYSEHTIEMGSKWLKNGSKACLVVPSAVLAQENNILINPLHSNANKIKIVSNDFILLDGRLVE
jgi:RES domain-containing protein